MHLNDRDAATLRESWNKQRQLAKDMQAEIESKIKFANFVLQQMEAHEEWDADMLDNFSTAASQLGLSFNDDHGFFRVKR